VSEKKRWIIEMIW